MNKLRALILAVGLAIPVLGSAAFDRYEDAERSIAPAVLDADFGVVPADPDVDLSAPAELCWMCFGFICTWVPC